MRQFNQDFSGWSVPSDDLAAVRDGRRARVQDYVIDLGVAHSASAGTAITLELPGTLIYADADPNGGVCTVHVEDTGLGVNDNAFYVQPGFTSRVPFTRLLIENAVQAGKTLRLHIGVDVDIQPGSNQQVNIAGTVTVAPSGGVMVVSDRGDSYGASYASSADLAANTATAIVAPGSNTNGLIVWDAALHFQSGTSLRAAFLAKTSAPSTPMDGDIISSIFVAAAGVVGTFAELVRPVQIAAGKGLYRINDSLSTGCYVRCRYTLL